MALLAVILIAQAERSGVAPVTGRHTIPRELVEMSDELEALVGDDAHTAEVSVVCRSCSPGGNEASSVPTTRAAAYSCATRHAQRHAGAAHVQLLPDSCVKYT